METPGLIAVALFLAGLLGAVGCQAPGPADESAGQGGENSAASPAAGTVGGLEQRPAGPYLLVLGTAQDGGLPHAACSCARCERARSEPGFERLVSSVALVLPRSGQLYLFDATPDIRRQLDRVRDLRGPLPGRVDRAPVDGVFLTHAHWGHYSGLGFFGFESVHTRKLPLFATEAMGAYLTNQAPWSQLVSIDNIEHRTLPQTGALPLDDGVRVQAFQVPHRNEFADTVGFIIEGPARRVLFVPDTDRWSTWEPSIEQRLEGIDVALLDGTFFSMAELPNRDVSQIGHPLIVDSLERLAPQVAAGTEVRFTHLNHSNPAVDPNGEAAAQIRAAGFAVAGDGDVIPL